MFWQLIYEKLPQDISERHVLLLDPILGTGLSAFMVSIIKSSQFYMLFVFATLCIALISALDWLQITNYFCVTISH